MAKFPGEIFVTYEGSSKEGRDQYLLACFTKQEAIESSDNDEPVEVAVYTLSKVRKCRMVCEEVQ